MSAAWGGRRPNAFLIAAGALFLLGLGADLTILRPRRAELRALAARRADLLLRTESGSVRAQEAQALARALGGEDLPAALALQEEDPLAYLNRTLARTGLVRSELMTRPGAEDGALARTRFSLRVQGSYAGILELIRLLELGPRLASVDALLITPVLDSTQLEGRLDVSIYDPPRRARGAT